MRYHVTMSVRLRLCLHLCFGLCDRTQRKLQSTQILIRVRRAARRSRCQERRLLESVRSAARRETRASACVISMHGVRARESARVARASCSGGSLVDLRGCAPPTLRAKVSSCSITSVDLRLKGRPLSGLAAHRLARQHGRAARARAAHRQLQLWARPRARVLELRPHRAPGHCHAANHCGTKPPGAVKQTRYSPHSALVTRMRTCMHAHAPLRPGHACGRSPRLGCSCSSLAQWRHTSRPRQAKT